MNPVEVIFDEEKYTLILPVRRDLLKLEKIEQIAAQNGFQEKGEFHITIVGFRSGKKIKDALGKSPESKRADAYFQIQTLINSTDWSFDLGSELYHISKEYLMINEGVEKKEKQESYIQLVNLPVVESFYLSLNKILHANLETPPCHITLYTKGDNVERSKMGIGIDSQEEFHRLRPQLIQL